MDLNSKESIVKKSQITSYPIWKAYIPSKSTICISFKGFFFNLLFYVFHKLPD